QVRWYNESMIPPYKRTENPKHYVALYAMFEGYRNTWLRSYVNLFKYLYSK
ncbi:hypothetical protein EVA_10901, partial [gut metagenome]